MDQPIARTDELEYLEDARTLECFPKALQYHLKADGELDTTQPTEPIAANFRLPDGGKGLTNPQVYKQLLLTPGTLAPIDIPFIARYAGEIKRLKAIVEKEKTSTIDCE